MTETAHAKTHTRLLPRLARALLVTVLVLAAVGLRACVFRPATNYPGSHFNRGHNAAWLGVEWAMEPHGRDQVVALASELHDRQITTVFVYVSYLKPDGAFNPTYDHAAEFVSSIKRTAPNLDLQAWLGIPVIAPAGVPLASGYVDLANADVRAAVANFAHYAVHDLGFDGVHLDPEPIVSGDSSLLDLLDEVHKAIGSSARLSISAREITPLLPEADLIINRWFTWRADYYREVAARGSDRRDGLR